MHQTISTKLVTIDAAWSCPDGHQGEAAVGARATLTDAGPVVHHPSLAIPTSCRICRVELPAPVLTVPVKVQADLNGWAERRGLPVATEWVVKP